MSVLGDASASTRSLSELSEEELPRLSLDLVAAARRNLWFLRDVARSRWLHHTPVLVEAIRRYDELWMPMMADATADGAKPPMILPPLDVEWVWFCDTLNPATYREYCESRFSKLIGKPAIFDEENKEYALERCREIWALKYPSEPFENESDSETPHDDYNNAVLPIDNLLRELSKQTCLFSMFSRPYMLEIVYLIGAKHRYKGFLYMLHRFADCASAFVPTFDILLMWITHKSYPTAYAIDVKDTDGMGKVVGSGEPIRNEDFEESKMLWEKIFDQPYEKAGCPGIGGGGDIQPPVYWEVTETDVNVNYRPLLPRFLLEVNVLMKSIPKTPMSQTDVSKEFLRFRLLRCHRDLKINTPITNVSSDSWTKILHLYCEFGTKGMVMELRQRRRGFYVGGSKVVESATFLWNELLRAPSICLDRVVGRRTRVLASITAPAQAPYLLKFVPDRVTDDHGAMVSEVVLRSNQYRPQEGRWLSRTVLDHGGRECFVVRMRVGSGFWRRGGNKPSVVKWEERCIEIREGSWSYVAGSIGKAPEKVVGTATPKAPPPREWHASWSFSTGHKLLMKWGSLTAPTATATMVFDLETTAPVDSRVRLLDGRQMQYKDKGSREIHEQYEDGFVTMVRFTEEDPSGKATALLNWKLSAVEFLPEEDAVLVLLLCVSILRSVTEKRKEDVGSLLTRRRRKEAKNGARDWGSVILDSSTRWTEGSVSPYVRPWYWNPRAVVAPPGADFVTKQPATALSYSAEEGGDALYKQALFG